MSGAISGLTKICARCCKVLVQSGGETVSGSVCKRCRVVVYCSPLCQRADYKDNDGHAHFCRNFKTITPVKDRLSEISTFASLYSLDISLAIEACLITHEVTSNSVPDLSSHFFYVVASPRTFGTSTSSSFPLNPPSQQYTILDANISPTTPSPMTQRFGLSPRFFIAAAETRQRQCSRAPSGHAPILIVLHFTDTPVVLVALSFPRIDFTGPIFGPIARFLRSENGELGSLTRGDMDKAWLRHLQDKVFHGHVTQINRLGKVVWRAKTGNNVGSMGKQSKTKREWLWVALEKEDFVRARVNYSPLFTGFPGGLIPLVLLVDFGLSIDFLKRHFDAGLVAELLEAYNALKV